MYRLALCLLSRIAHVLTYRSKDAVCVSAGYLRIRRCDVVRYDGLTTVLHPSCCRAVPRRRRIILVGLEFIVSGGLGRCSTMTQLTVESLSSIHSPFPYLRISFQGDPDSKYLYHDGSLSTHTIVVIRTPSQLWQRAIELTSQFIFTSSSTSPIFPMDSRNVSC
jgi:hypothetical protein